MCTAEVEGCRAGDGPGGWSGGSGGRNSGLPVRSVAIDAVGVGVGIFELSHGCGVGEGRRNRVAFKFRDFVVICSRGNG